MTVFDLRTKAPPPGKTGSLPIELLHRSECKACPLNNQYGLAHPHMEPTGSKRPVVYMLGEAPGADEDKSGEQFVGKAGKTLRSRIPEEWEDHLRWNNCVRTRPRSGDANRPPTPVEIECCRPSVVRDIEASKPRAIFGFGNVPLEWSTGQAGITKWRGRRFPLKVGKHTCWYYPMFHPSYVNRKQDDAEKYVERVLSDIKTLTSVSV